MDSRNNILSMLGLALRGKRLAVGEEPVEAVARARDARVLLLASDAADNTKRRCRHFAEAGDCLYLTVPFTKEELGRATGRTSVALLAMTDVGMAASLVHKLEQLDPKQYSAAAQRLDLKAKRAAERRAEMLAHEKNIRQGKVRHHEKAPESEPEKAASPAPEAKEARSPAPPRRRAEDRSRRSEDRKSSQRRTGGTDRGSFGGGRSGSSHSRPSKANRPKPRAKFNPYAHSLPVKKGKGSFRKRED